MADVKNPVSPFLVGLIASSGYRVWLLAVYLLVGAVCTLGIAAEFQRIDDNMSTLARERGSVLFRLVELTRDWNARHGGVYVPVTEKTQPNPYLKHKRRDLETVDGMRLTMINPAFMTRQIAEIAQEADGVKYHITSLNPIRPANAPDPWETEALKSFENGGAEALSLVADGAAMVHRYMAPLVVKQPCLSCHADQGYKLGDIRGGISVTMPADKILGIRERQRESTVHLFGGAALVVALLIHFVVHRTRRHFLRLRELTAGQERMIADRTQALSETNAQLRDEVLERQRKERQISESEARYRSVIETSQDAVLIMQAPDFAITFANDQALRLFDMDSADVIGRPLLHFVDAQDKAVVADRLGRRARGEPVSATSRVRCCQPDGSRVRVCDAHVARIESCETPQWVLSLQDVTDQLASERALKIAAAVMESASEGIVVTDAQNRIIEVNPAFTAITGYRPQEVLGKDPKFLGSGRHDREFFQGLWQSLAQEGHWEGEMWNRRPDGTVYVAWLAISTIQGGSESGGRHVATFIDITQRKEIEELLRHRAQSDPLTDLPNRNLFYDRLQMAMSQSRRYNEEFALLYIDLDYFKKVNDTLGHAAGDHLLIEAARRLTLAVRSSDTVARLGGDEFAVILPKVGGQSEVDEIAQRIVASLARPYMLAEGDVAMSASVGAAIYPQHGDDLEKIKAAADAALYVVKEAGRNGYRLYQPYCR